MKASVIVPFLNEERYIARCIEALTHQDFPKTEYELIFVDNGSVDQSAELVGRHPEIIGLREPTRGAYAARNRGLKAACGDIIAFTDADCAPEPNWLQWICEGMERTGAALALGQRRFPDSQRGVLSWCQEYEEAKIAHILHWCPDEQVVAFTNNLTVRTEVFRRLGPFREWERGADVEFIQRYLSRFPRASIAYLPSAVVTHMEIDRLSQWLAKQAVYGRSTARISHWTPYRPLGYADRHRIYRQCVNTHGYGPMRAMGLYGVLLVGGLCFQAGTWWEQAADVVTRAGRAPTRSDLRSE